MSFNKIISGIKKSDPKYKKRIELKKLNEELKRTHDTFLPMPEKKQEVLEIRARFEVEANGLSEQHQIQLDELSIRYIRAEIDALKNNIIT